MTNADIRFYDFDFKLLGVFGRCISSNHTVKYCGYGTAEIHFPKNEERILNLLYENEYLLLCQDEYWAVVTSWQVNDDIAVFGRTPEWLMTKRAIANAALSGKTAEDFARYIVETAMGDFAVLGTALNTGETQDFSVEGVKSVYDIVRLTLSAENLGFRLRAEQANKRFVFEVYKGNELRSILSVSNRTADQMSFRADFLDRATDCGWYEKIGEDGSTREWAFINESEKVGARRWEAVLSGVKTEEEAKKELSEKKSREEIETEVRRLVYGTDYKLGDVLRVQFETESFRKTLTKRITAVDIFFDTDRCGVKPVLE